MPTTYGNETIATYEDLQEARATFAEQIAAAKETQDYLQRRLDEMDRRVSTIRSELTTLDARTQRLQADVSQLDETLDAIADEAEEITDLLRRTDDHLSDGAGIIHQISDTVATQAQLEAEHRGAVGSQFTRLVEQARSQAALLRTSFSDMQHGLDVLTQAQQEGARAIQNEVETVNEALLRVESQVEEGLHNTTTTIQGFTQEKQDRGSHEASLFEHLLATQADLDRCLAGIQGIAAGLAGSSEQARSQQSDRVSFLKDKRLWDLSYRGAALLCRSDTTSAILDLEEAARSAPNNMRVLENLALAYVRTGDVERAHQQLSAILERDSGSPTALNALGVLHLNVQMPQDALPYLQRACELSPHEGAMWLNLGKAHYGCGQVAPALRAWQQARTLAPGLVDGDAGVQILLEEQTLMERKKETEQVQEVAP